MPSAGPEALHDEARGSAALASLIGPDHVRRFRQDLRAVGWNGGSVAVAISGGPDSTALLLLVAATMPSVRIHAATVDHGLRAASAREAEIVGELCRRLGIAHQVLRVEVPKRPRGVQAAARDARYAALRDWCPVAQLLIAHQVDDVAETLLMRLARGSGLRGLARMADCLPQQGQDGRPLRAMLRPLLDWTKADLLGICARAGVTTIHDPSNEDARFDRTRARLTLAAAPWLDPKRLARAATNLADAEATLEWLVRRTWSERARVLEEGLRAEITLTVDGLPHELRRRLVREAVDRLAGSDADRDVETLLARLEGGQHAMLADVQASPGTPWRFRRAPPRRSL